MVSICPLAVRSPQQNLILMIHCCEIEANIRYCGHITQGGDFSSIVQVI